MTTIKTIAPIAIEDLKQYFADNTTNYIIDYSASTIKGAKLLTYLSNLDLPCDIEFTDEADKLELLKEYFNSPLLVKIGSLEKLALDVLFQAKGMQDNNLATFIEENREIVVQWLNILDSLTLFNMYSINNEEMKDYARSFPVDETDSTRGINFVSLLDHEEFYALYQIISTDSLKFYKTYFDSYMFKGKNLYHYWANKNNPLFLLTWGISSGAITPTLETTGAE
jgi:hypothetical protein